MNVLGLDASLTATGVARINGSVVAGARVLKPPRAVAPALTGSGMHRLDWIASEVLGATLGCDVAVMEGLSMASVGSAVHTLAGLHYVLRLELWRMGTPVVTVAPGTLKKYAAGKGNADKDEVLAAAVRRFPAELFTSNNAADALWLAQMGADHYGTPAVAMPAAQRAALHALIASGPRKGRPAIDWPVIQPALTAAPRG